MTPPTMLSRSARSGIRKKPAYAASSPRNERKASSPRSAPMAAMPPMTSMSEPFEPGRVVAGDHWGRNTTASMAIPRISVSRSPPPAP